MTEFISKSGVKIRIDPASFKDALKLKTDIEKALIKNNVDVANIDVDFDKLGKGNIDFAFITSISKYLMIIDSDENVHRSIFKCLERCLYKDLKITEETFEDIEARVDYYEILTNCIKENMLPFLKTLFVDLKVNQKKKKLPTPKLKSSETGEN